METKTLAEYLNERGRKTALAQSIGVSKQTVSDWLRNNAVSRDQAAKVSAFTGIPKQVLCPDFDWGVADTVSAEVT